MHCQCQWQPEHRRDSAPGWHSLALAGKHTGTHTGTHCQWHSGWNLNNLKSTGNLKVTKLVQVTKWQLELAAPPEDSHGTTTGTARGGTVTGVTVTVIPLARHCKHAFLLLFSLS